MPAFAFPLLFLALLAPDPTPYTFGTGLSLVLPDGWAGPVETDESGLPRLASYRFENTNAESPLAGTVLHVERVLGLNPVMRERWEQGLVPFGYHGARPVAALSPSSVPYVGAVGFLTQRGGMTGMTFFAQVGQTYWAVQIEAPASVFEAQQEALFGIAREIQLGSAG